MTTLTITAADVGVTIARNGTLSGLRFLVADRGMYGHFTLADDAPPHAVSPWQIFNSDMLSMCTNSNGALQSPFGVCIEDATIRFGNLTVAACPHDAVFEVDVTTGALSAAEREATRNTNALDQLVAGTVFAEALKAQAQRRADDAILAAEAIRTWTPPPVAPVAPQPLPPVPDPVVAYVAARAASQVEAATVARVNAKDPTVFGPPLDAIKTGLEISARRQRAEAQAADEAAAAFYQRSEGRKVAREKVQDEATALLKEQGLL
jgi:hypothetical protein